MIRRVLGCDRRGCCAIHVIALESRLMRLGYWFYQDVGACGFELFDSFSIFIKDIVFRRIAPSRCGTGKMKRLFIVMGTPCSGPWTRPWPSPRLLAWRLSGLALAYRPPLH